MVKIWDESMRKLVRANPQSFLNLVLPGAHYVGILPEKLKSWQLEIDALLEARLDEQDLLVHIEFQTYHDATMSERLLRYNVLARSEHLKPVLSCVIYLLNDGEVQASPLRWTIPGSSGEQEILRFRYGIIEINSLSYEDILNTKQPALFAFMPLTKDGSNQECVERMFEAMEVAQNQEIELVGFTLAFSRLSTKKTGLEFTMVRAEI